MCIIVSKGVKAPESGVGWKLFDETKRGKLIFLHLFDVQAATRGRWLKATHCELKDDFNNIYTSGFHVYLRKPPDYRWGPKCLQVKFRKGHTVGYQYDQPVVVADELFIPLQKKK